MAKAKETKKVAEKEEHLTKESEEAAETLIPVEMTEEELDEFAEFRAQKEKKAAPVAPEQKLLMNLVFVHHINNTKYGPGKNIEVPSSLVGQIQVREHGMRDHELNLNNSKNRMIQVMEAGGPARSVDGRPIHG